MTRSLMKFLASVCILLFHIAAAQEKKTPQVLFLGDPVHQTIVQAAAKELGDQVSVQYPKGIQAEDSGTALTKIDELLGKGEWDIIYFNFGMGDLCYKDPSSREFRIMCKNSGGVPVSTPEQYEKQLDSLAQRLKTTKATIIWGSTTPMVNIHFFPSFQQNRFEPNAEQAYNTIAERVMAKHKIPVIDLHAHVMAQFKPEDKHPPYTQYAKEMEKRGHPLHSPLVQALRDAAGGIR